MIQVENFIEIYEINGVKVLGYYSMNNDLNLKVESHWNDDKKVTIVIPQKDGNRRISVNGRDLKTAIDNAMNNNRFP